MCPDSYSESHSTKSSLCKVYHVFAFTITPSTTTAFQFIISQELSFSLAITKIAPRPPLTRILFPRTTDKPFTPEQTEPLLVAIP